MISTIKLIMLTEIILLVFLSGCVSQLHNPPDVTQDTTSKLLPAVKSTNWLLSAAIIGMAVSVAAFINGSKLALPIFAGCATALGLQLMVVQYAAWLAVAALIASIAIFLASVLRKNVALKEIVAGVNNAKKHLGESYIYPYLKDFQSPTTENLVKKIKTKMYAKGEL